LLNDHDRVLSAEVNAGQAGVQAVTGGGDPISASATGKLPLQLLATVHRQLGESWSGGWVGFSPIYLVIPLIYRATYLHGSQES